MNWDNRACEDYAKDKGYDPFFPTIIDENGEEHLDDGTIWASFGDTSAYYTEAKEVCDRCPIKEQCRQYALDHRERWGMWGGTTPIERRRVERRERRERLKARRAAEAAEDS